MGLVDYLLVFLILAVIALVAYLFVTIRKVNTNLDLLRESLQNINSQIMPTIERFNNIVSRLEAIVAVIEAQFSKAKDFTESIKEGVSNFKIAKNLSPESRIKRLILNLSAISKGVSKFIQELKNN